MKLIYLTQNQNFKDEKLDFKFMILEYSQNLFAINNNL